MYRFPFSGVRLLFLLLLAASISPALAQSPLDLWSPVQAKIRDRSTLNPQVIARSGYFEVYYDSETDAKWADSGPPYAVHTGQKIRIHGYLATPLLGGPYPAIVIGHGHGGHGSAEGAIALAALGYVALSIDGPGQGLSTGPPDTEQGWISVEQVMNQPSPDVSYQYHYAYAGMRALTLFERFSRLFLNPFRIDANRLGVIGASMGGQFTYYINGADDRVKGAVAVAVAGSWQNLLYYEGSWLYHGLYYYTRDGLRSGLDFLNTVSNVCTDPTIFTFGKYFDPIYYAPTQHGPILTIVGSHDQYFTVPAINDTYNQVASAGTVPRFLKRMAIKPNGKHGIVSNGTIYSDIFEFVKEVNAWLAYCFKGGAAPPTTPTASMQVSGTSMVFRVSFTAGGSSIKSVALYAATQIDSRPATPVDFSTVPLVQQGSDFVGTLVIGAPPPSGPPASPQNIVYFAIVKDAAGNTVTSKLYYKSGSMAFGQGFVPRIEHFYRDNYPVPPVPHCP